MMSADETGKLQRRHKSLKIGMQQLTAINKKLRAAVSKCKHGIIEEYPDLEFININRFIGDLMGSTESLVVNVDRALESLCRIAKVKEGNGVCPELEQLAGPQEAKNTRQYKETGSEGETRSSSPPPPSSRTQKPARTDGSALGGPQRYEASLLEAARRRRSNSTVKPLSHSHYSLT